MKLEIPLPSDFSVDSYPKIKNYLKQLELAIHHAQKAVENAEKEGMKIGEDSFAVFEHPALDDDFSRDHYDELQNVVLSINIQ